MRSLWQALLLSGGVLVGSSAVAQPAPGDGLQAPVYPPALVGRNIGGEVILLIDLDGQGRARDVQVERSSGHPELDQAAVTAARTWTLRADAGGRVRVPVDFDPQPVTDAAGSGPLSAELLSMLTHWHNSQVPVRATDADGRLPWNLPDPLPLPDTALAELLQGLRQGGTRLPDADAMVEQYETRSDQGSFGWRYYPASHWRFGPAVIRQRLVSDGEKSYWLMAARSEASPRRQAALQQYIAQLGRQQPGPPPPPPPPDLLQLFEQHQGAAAEAAGQP